MSIIPIHDISEHVAAALPSCLQPVLSNKSSNHPIGTKIEEE
jgi:hypothetical protein